jgi:hypothetical protein
MVNLIDSKKINNIILIIIYLVFYYLIIKNNYKSEMKQIFRDKDMNKIKIIMTLLLLFYNFYDKTFKNKKKSTTDIIKENYFIISDSLSIAFLFSLSLLSVNKKILYPFLIIFFRSFLLKRSDKFNKNDIFSYIQILFLLFPFIMIIYKSINQSLPIVKIDNSNIVQHFINLAIGTLIINKFMDDRDYDLITLAYQVMIYTALYKHTILNIDET